MYADIMVLGSHKLNIIFSISQYAIITKASMYLSPYFCDLLAGQK